MTMILVPSPLQKHLLESFPNAENIYRVTGARSRGDFFVGIWTDSLTKMSYLHTHWRDVDVSNISFVDALKYNQLK